MVTFAFENFHLFTPMYSKYWLIIKDDSRRTFEVCGQASNENSFTNKTYAMQRAGMNVSCTTPPVTNKTSSKDLINIIGYKKEEGLYDRLCEEHREITLRSSDDFS
jgi:hypothetical protein